ncbi:BRO family protein [Mycolicibacterium anyangense]|uniref:BRO family protein n=1 Tax=Mycolicibacterium anyangense TaxID=1431246 RepID=UPI0038993E72
MRRTHTLTTAGDAQQMTAVSEAGTYEVVIRSNKPEAAAFRRWRIGGIRHTPNSDICSGRDICMTISAALGNSISMGLASAHDNYHQHPAGRPRIRRARPHCSDSGSSPRRRPRVARSAPTLRRRPPT